MTDVYSIAGVGMLEGQKRLESISRNAANASTPGYRRQVSTSRPSASDFTAVLQQGTAAAPSAAAAGAARLGVDLREGGLLSTGKPLDLAIEGATAYFGLSDGQRVWLTRAGSFSVDADGYLVGERGMKVQGSLGDLRLNRADVEVRADGSITHQGAVIATLQLFQPAAGSSVAPGSGTLLGFAAIDRVTDGVKLRSGHLESSNASSNTEVLGLLALTRQYESLVRVAQGYDDVLARTIQRLGEV
jgi:flagellar basal-body rod protein FlgF